MPLFISQTLLRASVKHIQKSAARDRLFEFLMLKRVLFLTGSNKVVFTKSNAGYKQTIEELGSVGVYDGHRSFLNSKYINVFDLNDKSNGYRSDRFADNGPTATITGPAWQDVIELDLASVPRQTGLKTGYAAKLPTFLLRRRGQLKPSIDAFAVWFLRHQELDQILPVDRANAHANFHALRDYTVSAFALNAEELDIIFDTSDTFVNQFLEVNSGDLWQTEVADSVHYLPLPDYRAKPADRIASVKELIYNLVLYGAPGTGKSWILNEKTGQFKSYTRVTFYPDYSFSQFVGGYKPKSQYLDEKTNVYHDTNLRAKDGTYTRRPVIDYVAVPGPFLTLLAQAYRHPANTYLLIVEELNRANAAAVFGDLFQLLDREANGVSTYAATLPEELANWVRTEQLPIDGHRLAEDPESGELSIRLPDNFFVWATMNSADQGVQPLDAAFKRRWTFEYIPLNQQEAAVADWPMQLLGRPVGWNALRRALNAFLMKQASGGGRALVPEDRLLGPFFMKESELANNLTVLNKLLLYLREDLVRHNPGLLFAPGVLHFSELYAHYLALSAAVDAPTDTAEAFGQQLGQLFVPGLVTELVKLFGAAPVSADLPSA